MKVTIYGYSDDKVAIEGDINDEWGAYDHPRTIVFGDGTVVKAECDDEGVWRVKLVTTGRSLDSSHLTFPEGGYTERLELNFTQDKVRIVSAWQDVEPTRDELEQHEYRDLDTPTLVRVHAAIGTKWLALFRALFSRPKSGDSWARKVRRIAAVLPFLPVCTVCKLGAYAFTALAALCECLHEVTQSIGGRAVSLVRGWPTAQFYKDRRRERYEQLWQSRGRTQNVRRPR